MQEIRDEIFRLFVNFGRNEPPEGTQTMWARELDNLGYTLEGIREGVDSMLRNPSADLRIANLTKAIDDTHIKRQHEEHLLNKQIPSLDDYRHRGKGLNLAPEIQRILDIGNDRERNMAFLDLSYRMVDKSKGEALTEWKKTVRHYEGRV